jgi:long-chain acyl-CoA synthetase
MSTPTWSFWTRSDRDAVAIIDPAGRAHTVGALQDRCNAIAHGLRGLGLRHGDVVAMVMRNEADVYALMLATTQIGLYLVPINWHLAKPEVEHILSDSGAAVVVCTPDEVALIPDGLPITRVCTAPAPGFLTLDALASGPITPPEDRRAGLVMNYTSGTTGRPKGVKRPLAPWPPEPVVTGFASFLLLFGMSPGEGVQIVGSPLYHTAVLYFSTSALHLGHRLVVMEKWTPEEMLRLIALHRVTSSHMVPTQFNRLLAVRNREQYDVSSLRHVVHSAAPCPVPIKRQLLEWWGDCVWEYYAATEGGGTVASPSDWRAHPGTVGRAWQGAEIAIFDDAGNRLGPGEVGTVWIKMQQGFEYHQDKAKTERAWRPDGYFTVGDAGFLDAEGWLFLSDRKADMIISGGVNIYPAEIETVLVTHPAALDVAVFGVPDDDWGEAVHAVIEARPGFLPADGDTSALTASVLEHCRAQLAKFKCPKTVEWVETLPRDPNGKLAKRKLRDPFWAAVGRSI